MTWSETPTQNSVCSSEHACFISPQLIEMPRNKKQKRDHKYHSFHFYLAKQRSYEHFKISHANNTNYLISKDAMTNKNQYHTSGPHPGYYPGFLDVNG